jgi:hydrogenase maturation protease
MPGLHEQLSPCFQGRVCLMGLGNTDYGDDGFGVRLAKAVERAEFPGAPCVIIAGTAAEHFIGRVVEISFDRLVFLDAVEFGGAPGSAIFLNTEQMVARFPQVSTHRISLGLLARWVEASGTTGVWLLGVQPESLKAAKKLTPTVHRTLEILRDLLCGLRCSG